MTQAAELRANLREHDASFRDRQEHAHAARGRQGRRRVELKELVEEGRPRSRSCGATPALAAKVLDTFARQANVLELKGGLMGGRMLGADEIRQLARLPARDKLNAQLAGVVASPLTGLVRGLGSMLVGPRDRARAGAAQKEAAGPAEAPAAEAPAGGAAGRGAPAEEPRRPRSAAEERRGRARSRSEPDSEQIQKQRRRRQ